MSSITTLEKKCERLVRQIGDNLDFLIGSVSSKGLKCEAYNLTTKVEGKTKTKHIPRLKRIRDSVPAGKKKRRIVGNVTSL